VVPRRCCPDPVWHCQLGREGRHRAHWRLRRFLSEKCTPLVWWRGVTHVRKRDGADGVRFGGERGAVVGWSWGVPNPPHGSRVRSS